MFPFFCRKQLQKALHNPIQNPRPYWVKKHILFMSFHVHSTLSKRHCNVWAQPLKEMIRALFISKVLTLMALIRSLLACSINSFLFKRFPSLKMDLRNSLCLWILLIPPMVSILVCYDLPTHCFHPLVTGIGCLA